MSKLKAIDSFKFLTLLSVATTKNVCEPKANETFTITRSLRASGDLEGDSQLATILFVGIAKAFNVHPKEIMEFISIEQAEYDFKVDKYREKIESASDHFDTKRFKIKNKLVRNYIKYYAADNGVKFRSIV